MELYNYTVWMKSKFVDDRYGSEQGFVTAESYTDAVATLDRYLDMEITSLEIKYLGKITNNILITEPFI